MSNPLQPKCIDILEKEFSAYVINITSASKSGHMDLVACIQGLFYGFEIKYKNDRPSELQKQKINSCIASGGHAYFVRSEQELRDILTKGLPPISYDPKNKFIL